VGLPAEGLMGNKTEGVGSKVLDFTSPVGNGSLFVGGLCIKIVYIFFFTELFLNLKRLSILVSP